MNNNPPYETNHHELLLISHFTVLCQAEKVVGNYSLRLETKENAVFGYQLTLNQDGTFVFHHHSTIPQGIPPELNKYGKGKWIVENNIISLSSDKPKDFDEKYKLDFTNSKARFITKSPRDKTDRIIKTRLTFLTSEIVWMKGIELLKM